MGVGFVALAAAQEAASGADLDAVEAVARSAVPRGHAFIVVHRLDNLRRSGRIRRGASLLGSALSLKPLLCIDVDGRLVLGQRIRTATKAHAAMIDQVAEVVGDGSAQIAVHHVDNRDTADDIAKTLTVRLPQIAPPDGDGHGARCSPCTSVRARLVSASESTASIGTIDRRFLVQPDTGTHEKSRFKTA